MSVFDEAKEATMAMFDEEEQPVEVPEAEQTEEVVEEATQTEEIPPEETVEENTEPAAEPTQEGAMLDEAVNTAEVASQMAQEKDMQLQQVMQELEALRAQNQQMQGTIEELSKKNEENLIEEAMQMPTLDVNGLAFATEEEIAQAQADYANKMAEFVKGGIMTLQKTIYELCVPVAILGKATNMIPKA